MESRDAFLNFGREKHCEFSSLRRAKFSTMAALIELHSSTADKVSYTCNACRQPCDIRYHCTVCEDYDLCSKCHANIKHEHRMDRTDDSNETANNADTAINAQQQRQLTMQRMLDAIRHAIQCRNANCLNKTCSQCKILLKHNNDCTKVSRNQCTLCSKLILPIWFHAKTCSDQSCPVCRLLK
jgi:E1A/CREB-binding protein